jgi:2-keto-3-deoxy-L-fuconate dehydrogenase
VNNSAVVRAGGIEETPLEDWTRLWDVNVLGYVRATRAALPYLRKSAAGAIANLSSFTAGAGFRRRVACTTTKGAIEALTRALAADLIVDGITVNAVRPGIVDRSATGTVVNVGGGISDTRSTPMD